MKKILLPLLFSLVFLSCKKNNTDNSCTASTASIAGTWKVTAIKYKQSASSAEQDYYSLVYSSPCEVDNVYVFNSNGTYRYDDRGDVCIPNDSSTGTWTVTANTLSLDGGSGGIQDFNCNSFKLVSTNVFTAGDTFTATWTKQ